MMVNIRKIAELVGDSTVSYDTAVVVDYDNCVVTFPGLVEERPEEGDELSLDEFLEGKFVRKTSTGQYTAVPGSVELLDDGVLAFSANPVYDEE